MWEGSRSRGTCEGEDRFLPFVGCRAFLFVFEMHYSRAQPRLNVASEVHHSEAGLQVIGHKSPVICSHNRQGAEAEVSLLARNRMNVITGGHPLYLQSI